ncbi:MAG: transcriptional regulator TrmB [Candidatus Berkelbacteria bacterium Licking1014_2]|uniref:Transcriptional regulator TrmB n=1 Tax=Candidatus Berkelbacteria bacterium Licking1014_2 TaxID=2017146 RepID=A0A554LSD5_9BACT|nr:MAG: transcriptional regulator TrmB [Candidatus Berkelbacteria bacterium Licking1014_2]
MLTRSLEKLGLSEKEAKVYLATLELGQAAVQQIAKKAGLVRPTTYVILESLMKSGLATTIEQDKKTLYAAESPEQLKTLLKYSEEEIKEKEQRLEQAMPELQAIYNLAENRPKVKFYEGKEGIIAMQEEFFRVVKKSKEKEIVGFTPIDELFKVFPDYKETYTKRRVGEEIRNRVIYTTSQGRLSDASDKKAMREARFIPKNKFPFSSGFTVYGDDRLALISYGDRLMGVAIESKELTQTFRVIFELAWEAAKKYN